MHAASMRALSRAVLLCLLAGLAAPGPARGADMNLKGEVTKGKWVAIERHGLSTVIGVMEQYTPSGVMVKDSGGNIVYVKLQDIKKVRAATKEDLGEGGGLAVEEKVAEPNLSDNDRDLLGKLTGKKAGTETPHDPKEDPLKPEPRQPAALAPAAKAKDERSRLKDTRNEVLPPRLQIDDHDLPIPFKSAVRSMGKFVYHSAVADFKQLVMKGTPEEIRKSEEYCRTHFSRNLADMMVFCYMQDLCGNCKGAGYLPCKFCSGSGYCTFLSRHVKGAGGPTPGTRRGGQNVATTFVDAESGDGVHRRVLVCRYCRGNGFEPCTACFGTRRMFHEPTPYEQEAYADCLLKLGDRCMKSEVVDVGNTQTDPPPTYPVREDKKMQPLMEQIWIRDSANRVKGNIMRMWRAETYYRKALAADPMLIARVDRDIHEDITEIMVRRQNLYGELGERQRIFSLNNVERRLDEMHYSETFKENGPERTRFGEILDDE